MPWAGHFNYSVCPLRTEARNQITNLGRRNPTRVAEETPSLDLASSTSYMSEELQTIWSHYSVQLPRFRELRDKIVLSWQNSHVIICGVRTLDKLHIGGGVITKMNIHVGMCNITRCCQRRRFHYRSRMESSSSVEQSTRMIPTIGATKSSFSVARETSLGQRSTLN